MPRFFSFFACLCGLSWVVLSALAAHAIQLDLIAQTRFDSAQRMLIVHALVLLLLSHQQSLKHLPIRWLAGISFCIGQVLFCLPVFILALGGAPFWSKIAPTGGALLMLGWMLWALALLRRTRSK
jgi:uncharacterized membrane protein YgdD (TMEM256/DUF423 family)